MYAGDEFYDDDATSGFVTVRLNALRCERCGHRMDDLQGCDDCAADRAEAERQETDDAAS